jgi:hypothetical protein
MALIAEGLQSVAVSASVDVLSYPERVDMEALAASNAVNRMVDEFRARCFWSARSDYYPLGLDQQVKALVTIQRHGDLATFRRASALRQWLLRHFSEQSVAR